jgi:hypothetical protein
MTTAMSSTAYRLTIFRLVVLRVVEYQSLIPTLLRNLMFKPDSMACRSANTVPVLAEE